MTKDECEALLRRWGRVYGEPRPGEWDEGRSLTGDSPLARLIEDAPGKRNRRLDAAFRRRVQAGERVWSRDPIPCRETRTMRGSPALGVRDRDPELTRVQTAWLELVRVDGRLGQFVRVEYQVRGTQSEKAAMLEVSRGVYREGVAEGRGWMRQALGCELELRAA